MDSPCIRCEDQVPCETCSAGKKYKESLKITKLRDQEWVREVERMIGSYRFMEQMDKDEENQLYAVHSIKLLEHLKSRMEGKCSRQ